MASLSILLPAWVAAWISTLSGAQVLPQATDRVPDPRPSGCPAQPTAAASRFTSRFRMPKGLRPFISSKSAEEETQPEVSYVYRMASRPANAHYEAACPGLGGVNIRFNDPCAWARGEAQITVAQFTQLCQGATRVIHWHDGADEWGYVNKGKIRTYVASPSGLPWPSSNNDISQHGVWYFPRGWLHGLMCLTPGNEGGCVITIFFSGPVSVPIDNHNLDTTLAQAPDDIAAAALNVDAETYRAGRGSFGASAGPNVNASVASSPLVTMVDESYCKPSCPDILQTRAVPAAVEAADVEKTVSMPGGVKLHQIRQDSFHFAATMSQERTEIPPGSFRPLVWVANADALLMVTAGNITLGLQGGLAGSSNPADAHKAYTEKHLGPGDVAYFPVGRGYWLQEATGKEPAATVTVFNVGNWQSVELSESMALMPSWAVKSNLRQSSQARFGFV